MVQGIHGLGVGETTVGQAAVEFLFQLEIDGPCMLSLQPLACEAAPLVGKRFEPLGNQRVGDTLLPQRGADLQRALVTADPGAHKRLDESFVREKAFLLQGLEQFFDQAIDALCTGPLLADTLAQFEHTVFTAAKKPVARKAPARKTAATRKPAAKKGTARKATARKTVARKTAAKKPVARKAPARKTVARKAPARKPVARKTTARKSAARKNPVHAQVARLQRALKTSKARPAAKKTAAKKPAARKVATKKAPARRTLRKAA